MRLASVNSKYYCGVDVHAKTSYVCVMNRAGKVLVNRETESKFDEIHDLLKPYLSSISVGCETTFNWYWLADGCHEHRIPFYLGHALYLKCIHGSKKKNDELDAKKLANQLRTNYFPLAYAYPREMRTTRDLLRHRHKLAHLRAGLLLHMRMFLYQHGIIDAPVHLKYDTVSLRKMVARLPSQDAALTVSSEVALIEHLDGAIRRIEGQVKRRAKHHDHTALALLQTIPGVGDVLGLTILYEMHTVARFKTAQRLSSYARVVKLDWESANKKGVSRNQKIGNPVLRWAFGEVATGSLRHVPEIKSYHEKLKQRHPKGKAMTILAHKFAVAVFYMLKNKEAFDLGKFLRGQ